MICLFWLLLLLGVYSYALYPAILYCASKLLAKPWPRADIPVSITVIVSAYNEEAVIAEKVANTLAMDYPPELLDVIVSSDGSTDRTDEIVGSIAGPRVSLVAIPGRVGKTTCLNQTVPIARGEILIFTDANALFPADLARSVARNFAAPDVGLVTGWTRYRTAGNEIGSAGLYTMLEHHTKNWESQIASCVGADGAIFAMRRTLFQPLQPRDINDFVLPLNVVRQGLRTVLDPHVTCIEDSTQNEMREFGRQLRITTRTIGAIARNADLLNPAKVGVFAFFLLSHKVMRFLTPFFLLALLGLSVVLARHSPVYAIMLTGQLVLLGMGLIGLAGWNNRLARLSAFLLVTMAAQLVAWFRVLGGASDTVWTPRR